MSRRSSPQFVERVLHDVWSSVRGSPPILHQLGTDAERADAPAVLTEAGSVAVQLDDESEFHGLPLPPSVTHWGRASCHVLRDARVVGDQGNVFTQQGQFVSICPSLRRLDSAKIRRPIPWLARRLCGPVFHLTGRDHENHGHFLMQHLPRLMAARSWLASQGVQPVILVPPGHEKWQGRYLSTLGGLGAHVVPCRTGTVSVEKLYYVPMLWDDGHLGPPAPYRQMQACFRSFAGIADAAPPSGMPIFVTRQDAPTRRLSNEAEIIDICRRQFGDIDVMSLREVPFVEQIRRFAEAPLVIGPQGQGLTNIIFSRQTRLLILEAGQSAHDIGWANVYRDFAHMTDNSALRLLSGGPWPDDGDWEFPTAAFSEQLQRVVALGLHHHRPPVLR
ncbi:MAG TPA: hypothetical protein DDZ88_22735 [Verrucomicrobiales bacterium]|nr:hypothetical protein [Verrucomicrobiales bacterium]